MRASPVYTGLLFLLCTIGAGLSAQSQQAFDLDTAFRAPIDTWYVSSIAPQPDGDVLLSGQIRFPADPIGTFRLLARVDASGQPVAGFPYGYGGGKLVEWNGRYYVLNNQIVRRVWPNGTTDTDFISMNLGPYFSSLQGGDYHVYPDGRVLMSGVHVLSDSIRGYEGLYCLCWFSNTGYLDTTAHHRNCSGSLDFFQALPNGKFIGSGSTGIWDGQPASNIIRFEADGELDTTFQANVWWGQAYGFLPLTDGRVYASGLFRITGISDTLNLVRFMPDGSLDPTFNNQLDFRITDMTNFDDGAVVRSIHQLDENRLVVTGQFELIEGEARRNICMVDTSGNLLDDYFYGPGCGNFTYQGETRSSIGGILPAPDGSYYIWGAYHGYDDGTTNDTLQRMVSRLYGFNVGLEEVRETRPALEVFPVPSIESLTVRTQQCKAGDTILIRDVCGRSVKQVVATGETTIVSVEHLPSGIYSAEVRTASGHRLVAKWIKQ